MKPASILAVLLAVSLVANIGIYFAYVPYEQEQISGLIAKTTMLSMKNMQLEQQLEMLNISLRGSPCSSGGSLSRTEQGGSPLGISGTATMLAPAVSQSVQRIRNGPFIEQVVVMNGSIMNISVNAQPGKGRILVETEPLMGIVFQDAANSAVSVAQNRTGADLSGTDIFFSIGADKEISAIDGPSAGGLMALLTIAALEHRTIDPTVTMTGTIDRNGRIGAVGGAVEKASAAKRSGLTHFLLPLGNRDLTIYEQQNVNYRGFQLVEYVTRTVDAKTYISEKIGIDVTYVTSIDDVMRSALK